MKDSFGMDVQLPDEGVLRDADTRLLRQYVEAGSRAAFDALVRRHFNFVNSICLRCLGNRQLAEDATQMVFIILARKAGSLRSREFLPAWLFQTARLTSNNIRKREWRRSRYEGHATRESTRAITTTNAASWIDVEPVIDDMLARLKADERNALLLRFYDEEDYSAIAGSLGISEEAARMRVSRALRKIRGWLEQQGIGVTSTTILTWLTSKAVQHLPQTPDFVSHIFDHSSSTIGLSKGLFKSTSIFKIAAAAMAVTASLVVTGVVQNRIRAGVNTTPSSSTTAPAKVNSTWISTMPDGPQDRNPAGGVDAVGYGGGGEGKLAAGGR